jgi:hypothetical protein
MWLSIQADIDPDDVLNQLDDSQLRDFGLARVGRISWDEVGSAIRRRDFDTATRLMAEIATKTGGDLPPFALTHIA